MTKRRRVIAGFAGIVLIAVGAVFIGRSDTSGRAEGGPLACQGCGGGSGALPIDVRERVSFGLVYLRNKGSEPAILEGVRILNADRGIEMVGSLVVQLFGRGSVGISREFPPRDPKGRVRPVRGFTVESARTTKNTVQVIIGLTVVRRGSFGFRHVALDYRVGDKAYRAVFRESLGLCAPASVPPKQCPAPEL